MRCTVQMKKLLCILLGSFTGFGATLSFQAEKTIAAPGDVISFDVFVSASDERIVGYSLLLQDPRKTSWFSLLSNLDRAGSPLSEPAAPENYHPWPQILGGPYGVNGYMYQGFWRGVDLGAIYPEFLSSWVSGSFYAGEGQLKLSDNIPPGSYEITADEIITSWVDFQLNSYSFTSIDPISLTVIPEPQELTLVFALLCFVFMLTMLLKKL